MKLAKQAIRINAARCNILRHLAEFGDTATWVFERAPLLSLAEAGLVSICERTALTPHGRIVADGLR